MPTIIDGKKISKTILGDLKIKIENEKLNIGLAVIIVGNDPASQTYVKNKEKACAEVGINSFIYHLPKRVKEEKLLELIKLLNKNKKINGILVQLPLPDHINKDLIIESINPKKDVDCFHPLNIAKLFIGQDGFKPCTPAGIIELIKTYKIKIRGQHAAIVGRSNIVGKPMAHLLLKEDATVTICHSKTKNLASITKQADILIAAIGQAKFIKKNMIKKGAVIIDVGINRDKDGRLCGDVDYNIVKSICKAITPVPGGVGPMTIAELLKNCLEAYYLQNAKRS